jgi:uncharacterized protein (TIGR02466 family)
MKDFNIHNLWPTPVYQSNILLKDNWVKYCLGLKYNRMKSNNGDISKNKYVLDDMIDLKNEIITHINLYTRKFLKIKKEIDFTFLNSWIIKHSPKDYANIHDHGNSILSGVYYLKVPKNSGDIQFFKNDTNYNICTPTIALEYNEYDNINCRYWTIKSTEGHIILFPSLLKHSVTANFSKDIRYSLSFNVFVKGNLRYGEDFDLYLK